MSDKQQQRSQTRLIRFDEQTVTPNDLSKLKTPYLSDSGKRITEKGLNGCSATLLPPRSLVGSFRW